MTTNPIERAMDDLSARFNTDLFAETIVYTTNNGGVEKDVPAHINRDGPFQEIYVRGENTATCEIEVLISDVPDPQHGETFTFDGYIWEFNPMLGITRKDSHFFQIALEREMS